MKSNSVVMEKRLDVSKAKLVKFGTNDRSEGASVRTTRHSFKPVLVSDNMQLVGGSRKHSEMVVNYQPS